MNVSQLHAIVPRLCQDLGIEPISYDGRTALRAADRGVVRVSVTMPRIVEEIDLSRSVLSHGAETLVDHFITGRDALFAKVHAHIAEHENTRVRQLEAALDEAIALIHSRMLSYGPEEYNEVARLRMIQRGTR